MCPSWEAGSSEVYIFWSEYVEPTFQTLFQTRPWKGAIWNQERLRHACITLMRWVWLSFVRECLWIVNNCKTFHDNAAVSYLWKCECGWRDEWENLQICWKESQTSLHDISTVHKKLQGALMEEINWIPRSKKVIYKTLVIISVTAKYKHSLYFHTRRSVHKYIEGKWASLRLEFGNSI